jgi:outer membrane receptor protein involved in Fe transport
LFNSNASISRIVNDRWSYRVSGGYFNSASFPRPTGTIPLITDPRDPSLTVGGAAYPTDAEGALGSAFKNRGSSQPKLDARIDQSIANGRVSYAAGFAGTTGLIYTGIGPFDIQDGSYSSYAKVNYDKSGLKLNAFANIVSAEAPNLFFTNPATGRAIQLDFATETYDFEAGKTLPFRQHQLFSIGGNVRRNNFDITIAPDAKNRTEIGAYAQDEIFVDRFRFTLGARVDKFGNLSDPVFSPRLSATYKPTDDHALRFSFNRAFRSPSVINNYLDINVFVLQPLNALAPLLPAPLQPLVANPFPLVVRSVGSKLPIGGKAQTDLVEESLTAYEVAYNGTVGGRTSFGLAFYVNDLDNNINFAQLPGTADPYTSANPPPGWVLPPSILDTLIAIGRPLPRTAFTYLNLGPIRQKGVEVSLDHRFNDGVSAFANYSWQADPKILDDDDPYPKQELALPPTNRFNIGANVDYGRFLGSVSVNYSDKAFWSDVLTSQYHGFTDSYTMVNGSFGVRWANGRVTTLIRGTNLLNQEIQQHVFGDIIKASAVAEVRVQLP